MNVSSNTLILPQDVIYLDLDKTEWSGLFDPTVHTLILISRYIQYTYIYKYPFKYILPHDVCRLNT